jgi:HAD superfamily phosphatase
VKPILVFDMDGVLVDVTESYREAIVETVRHFTGQEVSRDAIQQYKNAGGWNDDWILSQKLCADLGKALPLEDVVERFNRIFLGEGDTDGLIHRERWIPRDGLLQGLAERYRLAIFTGRHDFELAPTLFRYAEGVPFDPVITANRVDHLKPHPEGLRKIAAAHPGSPVWYVGDTVDDAASARAAEVKFIGIAEPGKPLYEETRAVLLDHGAVAVLASINELETVLG